ncbi:hypothetical protein ADUPG1_013795 [Aduncisulcus paluster]|uniref:Uncharacterized protein n=1 Tax=Aduncisulcus paluster TaxID=2918883 RepID=A0ABQ5K472_9EUKA|nr:hypothetical protein ADUPG1_013795 [Aduncisulcus paluster]
MPADCSQFVDVIIPISWDGSSSKWLEGERSVTTASSIFQGPGDADGDQLGQSTSKRNSLFVEVDKDVFVSTQTSSHFRNLLSRSPTKGEINLYNDVCVESDKDALNLCVGLNQSLFTTLCKIVRKEREDVFASLPVDSGRTSISLSSIEDYILVGSKDLGCKKYVGSKDASFIEEICDMLALNVQIAKGLGDALKLMCQGSRKEG